jgi:hypothetical protein
MNHRSFAPFLGFFRPTKVSPAKRWLRSQTRFTRNAQTAVELKGAGTDSF